MADLGRFQSFGRAGAKGRSRPKAAIGDSRMMKARGRQYIGDLGPAHEVTDALQLDLRDSRFRGHGGVVRGKNGVFSSCRAELE